jgi:hypothetical protein
MTEYKTKNFYFGFFRAIVCCDIVQLSKRTDKLKKHFEKNKDEIAMLTHLSNDLKSIPSVVEGVLQAIKSGSISSTYFIQNKLVELDKSTFIWGEPVDESVHIFFQMAHDRDDAVSKKKVDKDRVDIPLDDDEYISEFASIIYLKKANCFMIQRNRYSVSTKQIAEFLSKCMENKYRTYAPNLSMRYRFPAKVRLDPIMDNERLNDIKDNKCIEEITIKGDMSSIENLRKASNGLNLPVFDVAQKISGIKGWKFSLTISGQPTREKRKIEYATIDQNFCGDLYDVYASVDGQEKDKISVSMQYQNREDMREILIWASPHMEAIIPFQVNPREHIEVKEIYRKMIVQLKALQEKLEKGQRSGNY